jgi:hypothetical protein
METTIKKKKKDKNKEVFQLAEGKKLSAVGKWLSDPNSVPAIKIIDMRAVLR